MERLDLFLGKIKLCIRGKNEEKLEERDNSRRRISVNDSEMGGKEERYRSCSRYYWYVGSGARKPMGFLGPAHDESWSAGWHIILLIKAWMVGWKARRGRSIQCLQQTLGSTTTAGPRYFNSR